FAAVGADQVKRMDRPPLADAIDAADPLLETARIPRKLEVHHQAAAVVEVEAFGGRIGRQQDRVRRRGEAGERGRSFLAAEAAVQDERRPRDRTADVRERVAILREDDRTLEGAAQKCGETAKL